MIREGRRGGEGGGKGRVEGGRKRKGEEEMREEIKEGEGRECYFSASDL